MRRDFSRATRFAKQAGERTPHYLRLPKIKSKFHLDSFFPRTALQWNDLPADCFPPTYDLFKFKKNINKYSLALMVDDILHM